MSQTERDARKFLNIFEIKKKKKLSFCCKKVKSTRVISELHSCFNDFSTKYVFMFYFCEIIFAIYCKPTFYFNLIRLIQQLSLI